MLCMCGSVRPRSWADFAAGCAAGFSAGLSGEVRAVSQAEQRIIEAQRLGFHAAVLPMKNYRQLKEKFAGMELFGAETIGDALKCAMPKNI